MDQKPKMLIGTSNAGKRREILEVLGVLPYRFVSPDDLGLRHGVDESGDTYEQNAVIKARHYFEQAGILTLAEDSGIVVDALDGELGVKTRRWGAGEKASDEDWIEYFLKVMAAVPEEKRTARFICCAALIGSGLEPQIFVGETEGVITHELLAPIHKGLPLSSCFIPNGFDHVYAALTIEEKNGVSHRGKAMHAVLHFLERLVF